MLRYFIFVLALSTILPLALFSQITSSSSSSSSRGGDSISTKYKGNTLNSNSKNIIKSFNDEVGNDDLAEEYFKLSMELAKKKEYVKAETYMLKAVDLAGGNQKKKKDRKNTRIAEYYRELAKIQEVLKKTEDAVLSYQKASDLSVDKSRSIINRNDAGRVKSKSSPEDELDYLNQNMQIMNQSNSAGNSNVERAQTYSQMADVNKTLNKPDKAIENYRSALTEVDNNSVDAIDIKSDMAALLAETDNFEEAINVQKEVVEQSQRSADVHTQARQMRQLSEIYFSQNSAFEGHKILLEAYQLALEDGSVMEARSGLEALVAFYEETKDSRSIIALYSEFVNRLDTLISHDSSLIDVRLFEASEEKIAQLESEKVLKDELLNRRNRYNFMLLVSVLLLLLLALIIVAAWYTIRKRNKRIALQALRREMNPHFIFNSLNSVNQFIAENNELEANKYLTSYSHLMRRMMENSNKDFIPLSLELEQLGKYLELERMRFPDKFNFEIQVGPELDVDCAEIPNMLIQPHVENAIWHGLRYRSEKGSLIIRFGFSGGFYFAVIEDNGIGLTESARFKTSNQKLHNSRGLKNVFERIRLLNELYKTKIKSEIHEKTAPDTGVVVTIKWSKK